MKRAKVNATRIRLKSLALLIAALLAQSAVAATPTTLAIATGDNQTTTAGTSVPGVVCVIVTDAGGNPVPGVTVMWGSITGGGSLTGETQVTGPTGVATLGSWTLGTTPGINTITCTSPGLNSVTFTATATGSAATTLLIAAGNNQTALPGQTLPGAICALALDANGNAVPGVTVTWGNITGGGTLAGAVQFTQSNGIATLGGWTVGATAGLNTITATSPGLNSIVFKATVVVDDPTQNAVLRWNSTLLRSIANSGTAPTIAAREMAMLHTAMFDAWAAYDAKAVGTRLGGNLRRPASEQTLENKTIAVSFAAYRILLDVFPDQKSAFDAEMGFLNLDPTNASKDTTSPIGIGNTAAAEIISFRHTDGSNQLGDLNPGAYSDYTSYQPVNSPGELKNPSRWQPLLINGQVQEFLTPQWGNVTPFAIADKAGRKGLLPKKPLAFPAKPFRIQAQEILDLSAALTDQQKVSVTYWADGANTVTPPGHWCQFAQFVSNRDKHTLDDDIKMFFALTTAMLDSSIAVWDCKRTYDSVRPISAIHFLFANQPVKAWGGPGNGTQSISGDQFQTYIPTPPFPEYVSGHSTFSAAGCAVLALFTKKKDFGLSVTIPAGASPVEPGVVLALDVTLMWKTFPDAANEAGMSRRYAGIHFKLGDLEGRKLGAKIGGAAFKKAQQYIAGKVKN